ncbi:MAG: hypothetical protein NC336_07645 [Clostridium sp.]|nr:hypothetical protein [Clostridium sp.]
MKDSMYLAALKFRAAKLWEILDDSMIFAVALPSGKTGYVCVMGNGGTFFSLGLYRGSTSFNTYLRTVAARPKTEREMFEIHAGRIFTSCDFVNAGGGELTKEDKEFLRKLAADNGMKISRPNGWPIIYAMDNGVLTTEPDDEETADMTAALEAALEVSRRRKELAGLGFDFAGDYPTYEGGKRIPLLTPLGDGSYRWEMTETPPFSDDEYAAPVYNDLLTADKIRKSPHSGTLEVKATFLSANVGDRCRNYHPLFLLTVNSETGMALPLFHNGEPDEEALVNILADMMVQMGTPETICVSDLRTTRMLKDFADKTGIEILTVEALPELETALDSLYAAFR